eukprot:6500453-Prymnesium_polylepis.1
MGHTYLVLEAPQNSRIALATATRRTIGHRPQHRWRMPGPRAHCCGVWCVEGGVHSSRAAPRPP